MNGVFIVDKVLKRVQGLIKGLVFNKQWNVRGAIDVAEIPLRSIGRRMRQIQTLTKDKMTYGTHECQKLRIQTETAETVCTR